MNCTAVPLATIAIPTFNRADLLKRAVESARGQDYGAVEILIVDNASEDTTEAVCRVLAAEDPRIRYLRQAQNVGPVRNFETGLEHARGHYFMWLADDDWISCNYVRRCVQELEAGSHAIVAGAPLWEGFGPTLEPVVRALDASPDARILTFLQTVTLNSVMYGVGRLDTLAAQLPLRRQLGGDWLWVAQLLRTGTLQVVEDAKITRVRGGMSADLTAAASQFGHGRLVQVLPRAAIAVMIMWACMWDRRLRCKASNFGQAKFAIEAARTAWYHMDAGTEVSTQIRVRLRRWAPGVVIAAVRYLRRLPRT